PDSHIPDYFLRFSPVVMPVKVARCFHDHTGWFNNIRRNILMATWLTVRFMSYGKTEPFLLMKPGSMILSGKLSVA
ncbi:TPA: hypothetical protein KHA15_002841, partial [Escherichia coli]|nr:hypothetical protein [Escherichia coli]